MRSYQKYYDSHCSHNEFRNCSSQIHGKHFIRSFVTMTFVEVLAVIVLTGCTNVNVPSSSSNPSQQQVLPTRTFPLNGHGNLVLSNDAGSVNVHPGNGNSVVVQATKHVEGSGSSFNDLQVTYAQSGNTVTVKGTSTSRSGNVYITFDAAVPKSTDLNIQGESSDTSITGITGQIQASGESGNVMLNNTTGRVMLQSSSGNVTVKQANINGQSTLTTESGNINFTNSIDPNGSYHMTSSSGDVQVTLPASSSFQLKASTDSGNIENGFGNNVVGSGTHAPISIQTSSGNIQLQKQ